jgi:hypothetical protein
MQAVIENSTALINRFWTDHKRPTEQEYKKLLFDSQISWYEVNLIHAYQIIKALNEVSSEIAKKARADHDNYGWTEQYKYDFNKMDRADDSLSFISRIDHAFRHLNKVCAFAANYKKPYKYDYEWLIDFDKVLKDRLEAKYGYSGAKRTRHQKDSQADYLSQKYGKDYA